MKPPRIVLHIEVEADSYREGDWRYAIHISAGDKGAERWTTRIFAKGRATPEHVMELAQQALREAGR